MKPKPQHQASGPEYPPANGLPCDRRSFLRLISAAGLAAAAMPALADNAKTKEKTETKTVEQAVKELAAQLGDEDFRTRRAATKGLIRIGKGDGKDKKKDASTKELVLTTMVPLLKHKDPEVAQRARQIQLAVAPPKKQEPPPERIFRTAGAMVQKR